MSGECEVCGEHALDCLCFAEMDAIEEIQSELAPIIRKCLRSHNRNTICDALYFIIDTLEDR